MSKESEALTTISLYGNEINGEKVPTDTECLEAYTIIEQALKRNEPMKLKRMRVKVGIYDEYRIDDYCPTCDEELIWESNYCTDWCQKLDWSED